MKENYKIGLNDHIIDKPGRYSGVNHAIDWRPAEVSTQDLITHISAGRAIGAHWANGYRKADNFICSDFVAADIDGTLTLEEAQEIPLVRDFASFIYTTPSHREDCHRFRIVFLLDETITVRTDWADCLGGLGVALDSDKSINEAARLFYGSSKGFWIHLGNTLTKSEANKLIALGSDQRSLRKLQAKSNKDAAVTSNTRLSSDLLLITKDGDRLPLVSLAAKTPVHCPIHADQNPSALVVESQRGSKGVHCRTCLMTFWTDGESPYDFDAFDSLVKERQVINERATTATGTDPDQWRRLFPPSPTVHVSQRQFLAPLTYEPGITLVKSPKGTGKTAALAALIGQIRDQRFRKHLPRNERPNSILVVGHRRSLIREAAKRLGIDCYLGEIEEGPSADMIAASEDDLHIANQAAGETFAVTGSDHVAVVSDGRKPRQIIDHRTKRFGYAICLDSLPKLAPGPKYDTIIIDECEQVISHLLSETIQKHATTQIAFRALEWILRDAKAIYVLDADLGLITLHALKVLRPDLWKDNLRIIYNKPLEAGTRRSMLVYKKRNHILNELLNAVREGKRCFVACNSKNMVDTIAELLRKEFGPELRMMAITSENSQNEVESRFIHNIQRDILNLQVLVCSPSLGTGIDITFPGGKCEVHEVFGFISPYVNKHTDIDQQLARVRNPGKVSVWFSGGFTNFETNTDVVRSQLAHASYVPNAVNPLLDDDGRIVYNLDDPLLNIVTHVRVAQWASQNSLKRLFQKLRSENGWDSVVIEGPRSPLGKDKWKDAEGDVRKIHIQRVLSARTLTEAEYDNLSRVQRQGKRLRVSDRDALERAVIERLWGTPVEKSLIERYDRGRLIPKIHAYSSIFAEESSRNSILEYLQGEFDPEKPFEKGKLPVLAAKLMIAAGLVRDGVLQTKLNVTTEDFATFIKVTERNRVIIQEVFDTSVRKDLDTNPIRQFNDFIKCFGLSLAEASRININGFTKQSYRLHMKQTNFMDDSSNKFKHNYHIIYPWDNRALN